MKELPLIERIRRKFPAFGRVRTGIGDDAAVLDAPAGVIVVTTDVLVAGTHFSVGDPPERIGRKALAVSLSDVAGMGCRPTAGFLAVSLGPDATDDWIERLLGGVAAVAAEFDCPLAGGDTTATEGPVVLCSTVTGEPWPDRSPVRRSGARPGEAVFVTGDLGGSLAGRHLTFSPRVQSARELVERWSPGGMLDVSDGLSTDAWHLARESGVGIVLAADRIPLAAEAGGRLEAALNDGEDFELLFTAPAESAAPLEADGLAGVRVTRIGTVHEGPASVRIRRADGREEDLDAGGYEHFADHAES